MDMPLTQTSQQLSLNQFFSASKARIDRWRTLNASRGPWHPPADRISTSSGKRSRECWNELVQHAVLLGSARGAIPLAPHGHVLQKTSSRHAALLGELVTVTSDLRACLR
jgi:hypothetical protein